MIRSKFAKLDGPKFLFVYMAGHGASEDVQYFVMNNEDKVLLPIENILRENAETYDIKILAVYDMCREAAAHFRPSDDEEGARGDAGKPAKVGKEYSYMSLGAAPTKTIDINSVLAQTFDEHMAKKAGENNGIIKMPGDLGCIGAGIQVSMPTIDDPYTLKFTNV